MDVPRSADFVVIGGGCIGTAVACYLARKRAGTVVLFEKDELASGSTGRAAGLITLQWQDEFHLRLATESTSFFEMLSGEPRFGLRFRQPGYIHLYFTAAEADRARRAQVLQKRFGVQVDLLTPAEVGRLLPGLNTQGVVLAANCARDGYTDPHLAVAAFAELAKDEGARIFTGVEVTGIDVADNRVTKVRTTAGEVSTGTVVDAAGPWAAVVSRQAGIDIPVRPFRRQLWFTSEIAAVPEDAPVLMDQHHDFYFRRESAGTLLCVGNPAEEISFRTDVDWSFAERVADYAIYRFPPFGEARLASAWAAPRDITPDHDAILGPLPELEGLYVAAGHSGHGFMLSPAVGRMMADLIVDGRCDPDYSPLGFARFAGRTYGPADYRGTGV